MYKMYGKYRIYTNGKIYSEKSNKFLKPQYSKQGYQSVNINGKLVKIHRLIALLFLSNKEKKPQVNHINGIKDDNRLKNLEWCTVSENIKHAWDNHLINYKKIDNKIYAKLSKNFNSKKTKQYDLNGNLIKEWNCLKEAALYYKISPNNISYACNGKHKTACGYIWKYS